MGQAIQIDPGERRTLISSGDVREFFADIVGNVELELSETFAGTSSERAAPDDRGRIAAARGTEVVAFNPAGSSGEIELSPTGREPDLSGDGFYFERQQRVVTRVAEQQNRDNVFSQQVSVGTTPGTLPAQDVPDGFDVTLKASGSNADSILVGGTSSPQFPLNAGEGLSLSVTDVSDIVAEASSGTQTLFVVVEI
jgi:hypothetical protein